GGNKKKKLANKTKRVEISNERNNMMTKEDKNNSEFYGVVLQCLGQCLFKVKCGDGLEHICHLPKSLKKKGYIQTDMYVLVNLRGTADGRGDIMDHYTDSEFKKIMKNNPKDKSQYDKIAKS